MPSTILPSNDGECPQNDSQHSNVDTTSNKQQSMWISLREILDSDKSPDFTLSKLTRGNIFWPTVVCSSQTIVYFSRIIMMGSHGIPFSYKVVNYLRVLVLVVGWAYIYFLKKYKPSDVLSKEGKRIIRVGNAAIVLQALMSALILLIWVLTHDDCHSDVCLEDTPKKIIPLGTLLHQIMAGIAMPMFFVCHDVSACLLSISITYVMMLVAGVLLHLPSLDLFYVTFMGMSVFVYFINYEINTFEIYSSYIKFEFTLREKVASENKEYLMNIQTEEMRHMIGRGSLDR
jgi:hypothetical protein